MTDERHVDSRTGRELKIAETFVALADTMVESYDLIEFLDLLAERCVELLPTDEAGIMLADRRGNLLAVASVERAHPRDRAVRAAERRGPVSGCLSDGQPGVQPRPAARCVALATFRRARGRRRPRVGLQLAAPVRHDVIGALNLFRNVPGDFTADDNAPLARALANVATIGLLQQRSIVASRETAAQLQVALLSRVLIEQAKGMIAERRGVDVDEAFALLRSAARRERQTLTAFAEAVVHGRLDVARVIPDARSGPPDDGGR